MCFIEPEKQMTSTEIGKMTSTPTDQHASGGSVAQSAQDSTLAPPPGFPTIQEAPTLPNPASTGQITITAEDKIAALKADMRIEMEALRKDIRDMVMGKGKRVAEKADPEPIPPEGNPGNQEQQVPMNHPPST